MKKTNGSVSGRARGVLVLFIAALAAPLASTAGTLPAVQAQFEPAVINMRTSGRQVKVVLTAASGDLAGCQVSDVNIGTAAAVAIAPSAGGRTYVATFNESDLSALPAFDTVDAIVTGTLQCNGVTGNMIAHGTVGVLKPTTVQARVKPIITLGRNQFKDLNGNGQLDPYEDWRLPVEERVEDLLSRMTLVEKAGLMQITSYNANLNQDYIQNRQIRHLILRVGLPLGTFVPSDLASQINDWQAVAEGTRLGIPLVLASNPLNNLGGGNAVFEPGGGAGSFSTWPGTLGLAATNNLQLIRDFAEIAREEWRATGIRKIYGYQVDVASEPRWPRNETTFGEGPWLSAAITRAIVLGFQGQQLGPDSVAQTIKHFPGDGSVHNGLDPHGREGQFSVYPTPGSLFNYQIVPFQAAVDAGTSAIMSYYNRPSNAFSTINGDGVHPAVQLPKDWWQSPTQQFEEVGAAYNQTFLTKLLRGYMGFKGYVNTDSGVLCNSPVGVIPRPPCPDYGVESLTVPQRFAKAVKAGVNIFSDNNDPSGLLAAVNQGLLTEADLNPSVRLLLTEMFKLGLFEDPYTDPIQAQAIAKSPAHQAVADEAHRESIVLMRNDQHVLPFTSPVNLYVEVFTSGAAAAQQTASLKALLANDPLVHVVDNISQANAALLWLLPSTFELPDKSRVDIALGTNTGINVPAVQQIEAALPTVLAINFATAWVINDVEPQAAAVIGTYDVSAQALIDLVRGRFVPSGKLVMSIPANQAAVDNNASDVPGYLEAFDYSYRNAVNDKYIFGFGKSNF
jgi:beta-glucosidase